MALRILFFTLPFLYRSANALSQNAIVGLWSDSECNSKSHETSNFGEPDPIALNFTLSPDVCGVPGATVHSYRLRQKAICANGTTAFPHYYNSNNCTADPTDEDPNPPLAHRERNRRQIDNNLDDDVNKLVGECLGLVAFNSLAFVCEGIAPLDAESRSLPSFPSSSTIPSASSMHLSTFSYNISATATTSSAVHSTLTSSTIPSATVSFITISANASSATSSRATSSSATSSPATSLSATTPSATTSPSTGNAGSKSGFSTGASASIGVGFAIGVLAIVAL